MPGVACRWGRHPSERTLFNQSLELIEGSILEITQTVIDKAIDNKDVNAATYLIDRIYGKPKQAIEQKNLNIDLQLSPAEIKQYLGPVINNEYELLNPGNNSENV